MNENTSKLNIQFVHENKTYNVPLFDEKFADPGAKKITVGGRKYFYEENAQNPECVKFVHTLLKSLSEDKTFKSEKKLVSYISRGTEIAQMSITNDIYEIGRDRLIGRTNVDSDSLEQAKNTLYNELIESKPEDKEAILTIINKATPPLNEPKVVFEIADQIENNGSPELAHSIREAVRPFDLQPLIRNVPEMLEQHYIDPDKGKIISEKFKALFDTGKYEKFYDRMEFFVQMCIDLKDIGNDRHLELVDRKVEDDQLPMEDDQLSKIDKVRVPAAKSHVENDIGYLELTHFENLDEKINGQPVAILEVKQALDQIKEANPKAIILDLRENSGGSMYMMAYIASHFIKPDQELGHNVYRDKITPEELRSFPTDPVKTASEKELPLENRMLKQPIFILTSKESLSAAEALAYHLKEHRQATILGEITGGGAHVSKLFEVSPDFYLGVSFGDYLLKSGEPNWEAKGLTPDIQVNTTDAKDKAMELIATHADAIPLSWSKEEREKKLKVAQLYWEKKVIGEPENTHEGFFDCIRFNAQYDPTIDNSQDQLVQNLLQTIEAAIGLNSPNESQKSDKTKAKIDILVSEQRDKFLKLFASLPRGVVGMINHGEGLNAFSPPPPRNPGKTSFTESDLQQLQQYMKEIEFSGVVCLSDSKGETHVLSSNDTLMNGNTSFAMHSIGKMFTGMLAMKMIEMGIIPEPSLDQPQSPLDQPIQLDPEVMAKLPKEIRDHLTKNDAPTFRQLMLHKGGLGDYLPEYEKAIQHAIDNKEEVPKIQSPEDFIKYAETEIHELKEGETHYSNLGLLLVGLSIQHHYNLKNPTIIFLGSRCTMLFPMSIFPLSR
jgi:retinol-binding protein 3